MTIMCKTIVECYLLLFSVLVRIYGIVNQKGRVKRRSMANNGYTGVILKVDLSSGEISRLDTAAYADRFLGGRGIAAKLYWDETAPDTEAYSPDNCLIFITGPLAGFTRFAGCRWQICGKSAAMQPEAFSYANLGGSWGAWLKYTGYDGLVIKGKAEKPVYVLIGNDRVEIHDASNLWGKTTHHVEEILQNEWGKDARVLSTGPAGEHMVAFSTVLAADNASGSSGFGGVMGSKNLKAIVIKNDRKIIPEAADPDRLKSLAEQVYQLRIRNYEDYEHLLPLKIKLKACHGCISGCTRGYYQAENGWWFKSLCQASGVYAGMAMRYYGGMNEESTAAGNLATRLCDEYGLDTSVVAPLIEWLGSCYREGILTGEESELPLSKMGSIEFFQEFVKKVSFREGFGDILARGTLRAAEYIGRDSEKLTHSGIITRANETRDYDPRLILANAMIYATEPRRAIQLLHATALPIGRWKNWRQGWQDALVSTEVFRDIAGKHWGSPEAGDLSSFEGKALASKAIQDYGYVKESMIGCDFVWPIFHVRDIGEYSLPGVIESMIISAVTGRDIDRDGLMEIGERNFNLQRSVMLRQGWGGRKGDTIFDYLFEEPLEFMFIAPEYEVPGKEGEITSRKGSMVGRQEFENLKDEYYGLRGWDIASGLQTEETLSKLDMADIGKELDKLGLVIKK